MLYIFAFPVPDANECVDDTDNCHTNADCMDNIGSFSCMCSSGYSGDGIENCTGEREKKSLYHELGKSDISKIINIPCIFHSQILMNVILGTMCVM